jgi:glycosyltransferase involved in cell wall biosynthesis
LVSVVIPTYQRAAILGRAIESVLDQSYPSVEVIVVDDGSTDGTRALVEKYIASYGDCVRYLYQPNAGVTAARNLGLKAVRGEFIALLDSDDVWLPWKLTAQVALLQALPEVGMTWTDMTATDEAGTVLMRNYLRTFYSAYSRVNEDEIFSLSGSFSRLCPAVEGVSEKTTYRVGQIFGPMLMGNLVHTSTVLMRRERLQQIGGFDTELRRTGEDYDFHLRNCACGPVALLDEPSILYRVGADDQLTASRYNLQMARNNLTTIQKAIARAGDRLPLSKSAIAGRLARSHGWLGREELRSGDRHEARRQFGKSLAQRPLQPTVQALWLMTWLPGSATRAVRELWQRAKALGRKPAVAH